VGSCGWGTVRLDFFSSRYFECVQAKILSGGRVVMPKVWMQKKRWNTNDPNFGIKNDFVQRESRDEKDKRQKIQFLLIQDLPTYTTYPYHLRLSSTKESERVSQRPLYLPTSDFAEKLVKTSVGN
jgi:hypothetical protein